MPSSQLPLHSRRAQASVRATSPRLIAQVAGPCLFAMALGLAVITGVRGYRHLKVPKRTPAKEGVDVFSLSRTPTVAAGHFRFAILGLGQDPDTGKQIVWVRSITTNRIGGFAVGDPLFDSPVQLAGITPTKVTMIYDNAPLEVALEP